VPGQKFYNFTDIRDEIVRETDRLTCRINYSKTVMSVLPLGLNLILVVCAAVSVGYVFYKRSSIERSTTKTAMILPCLRVAV
jgi:hypothetical protein